MSNLNLSWLAELINRMPLMEMREVQLVKALRRSNYCDMSVRTSLAVARAIKEAHRLGVIRGQALKK